MVVEESGMQPESQESPSPVYEFQNWGNIANYYADNVFYTSMYDHRGVSAFTFTFATTPPAVTSEEVEQRAHRIPSIAQSRVTIPYASFKSMIDFTIATYEAQFGEPLPSAEDLADRFGAEAKG